MCESSVNDCECNPCFNGGSCQSGVESYFCHCPFGKYNLVVDTKYQPILAEFSSFVSLCHGVTKKTLIVSHKRFY